MVRVEPVTPDDVREVFDEFLADALRGEFPPSDTGLAGDTLDALTDVAQAVNDGQPTDQLVAVARAVFEAEIWVMRHGPGKPPVANPEHLKAVALAQRALDARGGGLRASVRPGRRWR